MDAYSTPRPGAELLDALAQLSPKQRQVFDALQQYPDGAQVIDLAERLGMHVNTVRGHLDELVERGVVGRQPLADGRRGRPSYVFFARAPQQQRFSQSLVSLVDVLAERLTDGDVQAARELGRSWARRQSERNQQRAPESLDDAVEAVVGPLRDMGFDPHQREVAGDDAREVGLHACPFITEPNTAPPPEICALHWGFLEGTVGKSGKMSLELMLFDRPGECGARIEKG